MITIKEVEWYQLDDIARAYKTLINTGMIQEAIGIYCCFDDDWWTAIYIDKDTEEEEEFRDERDIGKWLISKVHEKEGMSK